ncbi:amidohydrolase family protein [Nocardioides sp. TF02-7]|uniref:amidohydrolase family protein n=1 Tax=Nocardioides sp. TF02-7 TaxID=2917724 RepID=UPI001F05E10C|nr:amidohydrolase family protein [Nocardioides sp. TF02-7]UMG91465.1 amidohydrolase family protein [Nocardioides sp. TF02-7]
MLADHWAAQPWVTGTWFRAEAHAWERLPANGHSFVRSGGETRTAWVQTDGDETFVLAGLTGLVLLKTTGSEFRGFPRDRFTTLAETEDRVLATSVTATWRYAAAGGVDFDTAHAAVRAALVDAFARTHSRALQQTIHAMGGAALDACPRRRRDPHRLPQPAPLPRRPGAVRPRQPRRGVPRRRPSLRPDLGDPEPVGHRPGAARLGGGVVKVDAVRGRQVLVGDELVPATVVVRDGRVAAVAPHDAEVAGTVLDAPATAYVLPGVVDTHVHVNEPGRTEWEGFVSATAAAALGGVTTLVDMPLNSLPPTTTVEALGLKRAAAAGELAVDVGFWGGVVPDNLGRLAPLWEAGVLGFKCFLAPSGVEEFPPLAPAQLTAALTEVASLGGLVVVHAEDAGVLAAAPAPPSRAYADFLLSRPDEAETAAVQQVVGAARETGCRVHVLHLSSARALDVVAAAKEEGAAGDRGDLPALPVPHGRAGARRRRGVQVLSADPRRGQPRAALAGGSSPAWSTRW